MKDIRIEKARLPTDLRKYFEPALCSSCYICHIIQIFQEVKRVLRKDGVCFINCGDSYFAGKHAVLKPKDLCLIPFRLAIALQEDGWWVRSVIIWNKINPMPESVRDRPTESHEYILMLTKGARYYYDQEAVREPLQPSTLERYQYDTGFNVKSELIESTDNRTLIGVPKYRGYKTKRNQGNEQHLGRDIFDHPAGRNMRSVWTFSTQPYPEAHFATYPEELVRRCVKASTPEVGCCPKCGNPWVRITGKAIGRSIVDHDLDETQGKTRAKMYDDYIPAPTLGWLKACKCEAEERVPSIVLDPFAGSGTTLAVAKRLGRRSIGYELSGKYCRMAVKRIEKETAPMKLES